MNVQQICEAIRAGTITLNMAGHRVNGDTERFLKHYDDYVSLAAGSNDGKWSNRQDEPTDLVDTRMREFHQQRLDRNVEQEAHIGSFTDGEYCFGCGEKLNWSLTGDTLQLRSHWMLVEGKRFGDFVNYPANYVCPFAVPRPTTGEIYISSRLIFANYFRHIEDAPEADKHSDEWSLNNEAGRLRITNYKAARNVAYGQMGNMSIGVYVNKAKDSIIIGPAYHPAEYGEFDSDAEYKAACDLPVFPDHELVETISLAVWRWEAADLNTIGQAGYDQARKDSDGMVELDVQHGIWTFEHRYRVIRDDAHDHMYARLTLKHD